MKQGLSAWRNRWVACALLALAGSASAREWEEREEEGRDESYQIEQRQRWFMESRGLDKVHNARAERARAARELKEQVRTRSLTAQLGPGEVWQPLGPSSMQMGTWAMGRVSGRANAIVPDPTNDSIVYFGAAAGGVWKTTDAGASWTPLFDQVGTLPIGSIFVDPPSGNMWVGTGDKNSGDCAGYFGQGIFVSSDGGATWSARNGSGSTAMPLAVVNAVAVQPTNSNFVLAGGAGDCGSGSLSNPGVFRSTDSGTNWSRVLSVNVEDLVFVPGTATVYAAAPGAGVYKSTDGGATWALSSNGMTVSGTRMRLAMAPSNSQVLYALVGQSSPAMSSLYRSTDGGATWSLRNSSVCEKQCGYNQALDVHPTDPNTVLVGALRPAYSTDGGATFTMLTDPWGSTQTVHGDIQVVRFSRQDGRRFWIGSDGGLWRTDDGGATFTNMNSNLNVTQFYDIAVDPNNSDIVFGGAQDNSSSVRNSSQVWNLTFVTGDGFMNGLDPVNPSIVFQATYPDTENCLRILRSTSGGGAGTFSYLPGTGSCDFAWVTPLAVASNYIFVGSGSGPSSGTLYRGVTSADPFSWTAVTSTPYGGVSVITPMQQGVMLPTYVGTAMGHVLYSADAAAPSPVFTEVTGNLPTADRVSDVAMTPGNPQRVFVTRSAFGSPRLYRSTTGGTTWTAVGSGLPNVPANAVAIDPQNTQRIFVGTDVGVYESTDGGDTFIAFSAGLPLGVVVMDLEVDDSPHYLHAATFGRGAWKVALQAGSNSGTTFLYSASNTNSATQNTANRLIALTAGQTITLGTCGVAGSSFSGDTYLNFYAPNGTVVASSDDACGGSGSNFTYTVPTGAGGNYELRAGCFASQSCSGTVAWSITGGTTGGGGGSEPTSGSLTYTASNTNNATQNTSNSIFALTAGQTISLGTCGVAGASFSGDTYLNFVGPNGTVVASNDDACGGSGSNFTYIVPVGASGNYELRAGCFSSDSCRGTVAWTITAGSGGSGSSLVYSASNTNSATQNTANRSFALTPGQTITLGTCGVPGSSHSGDTYLNFYGPNGTVVASNDDACGSTGSNFTYTVPTGAGGNYELRAGCYSSVSCSGTVLWTLTGGSALTSGSLSYGASNTCGATQNTTN